MITKHRSYELIDFGFILGHKHKFTQCGQVPHGCIFNSVRFKRTGFIGSGNFGGRGTDSSLGVLDACKGFYYNIGIFFAVERIIESLVTTAVVFQAAQVGTVATPFERFVAACVNAVAFGDNELVAFGAKSDADTDILGAVIRAHGVPFGSREKDLFTVFDSKRSQRKVKKCTCPLHILGDVTRRGIFIDGCKTD